MVAIEDKILDIEEIQYLGEHLSLYMPNLQQAQIHQSEADYVWIFGGNRSGKTYCAMSDLTMAVLNVHPVRRLPENSVVWVCTESWEMVRDVLWTQYLEKFIPKDQIADIMWGQSRVPNKVYFKNGNILTFKAFNQGRKSFQGGAPAAIYADEQCLHDFAGAGIFSEIQARLIDNLGFLVWSMTPIVPQIELELRIENLPSTDEIFYLDLEDNRKSRGGYLDDARVDALIADWPEEVLETRKRGRFASYVGSVYKTFDRKVHVIESFPIPDEWDKYRGIDFGFANPFVCLWVAVDGDGNYFVYDEYYKSQTGIQEHIKIIKSRSGSNKFKATFGDPENAENMSELRKAGIPTLNATKDVFAGIECVQSKLKIKGNGDPSLYIFGDRCKNTPREFATYKYSENRDDVVKTNDHCVDVARYVIYSLEKKKTQKPGRATIIH